MDPVTGAALAALLLRAPASPEFEPVPEAIQQPDGVARWGTEIAAAARRFVVPEAWIRAVMAAESAGDPRAISPKGAIGLMQLMPETWREMRDRWGLGGDPFDPADNVTAGTAYLRLMYDRFGSPGCLAAYNAGPKRFAEVLSGMAALPEESRAFQETVTARLRADGASAAIAGIGPDTGGLFFSHTATGGSPSWRDIFVPGNTHGMRR